MGLRRTEVKSKTDAINDYFSSPDSKVVITRKNYYVLAVAFILAIIGVAASLKAGSLSDAGFFGGGIFVVALLVAVYGFAGIWKNLLGDRDAKRFVDERVMNRCAGLKEETLQFFNLEENDCDELVVLSGFDPDHAEDKNQVRTCDANHEFVNSFEATCLCVQAEKVCWFKRWFVINTPEVEYVKSHGELPIAEIKQVYGDDREYTWQKENAKKPVSFKNKYLVIEMNDPSQTLVTSVAHFGAFDENGDRLQHGVASTLYKAILRNQRKMKFTDEQCAGFDWGEE